VSARAGGRRTFLGQVVQTLLTRGIGLVLAVPTSVLLARGLVPASRGAYTVILTSVAMASLFAGMGLAPANVRFAARHPGERGTLLGNSLAYSLLMGVLTFLVSIPFLDPLGLSLPASAVVGLLVTLTLFSGFAANILLGAQMIARYNVAQLVEFGSRLAAFLVVFLVSRGVWQFVVAYAATMLLKCIYVLAALGKAAPPSRPSWRLFVRQVGFGFPLHVSTIFMRINSSVSIYILRFFQGDAAVGFYSIPLNYLSSAKILPMTVASLLLPRVAATGDGTLKNQTAMLLRVMLLTFTAGTAALFLAIPPLFGFLYGTEYAAAIPAARIILLAFPLYSFSQVSANYLIGGGSTRFYFRLSTWSFLAGLAALVLLVPSWGIRGAAFSVVLMEATAFVYCVVAMTGSGGFTLRQMFVPGRGDWRFLLAAARTALRGRAAQDAPAGSS